MRKSSSILTGECVDERTSRNVSFRRNLIRGLQGIAISMIGVTFVFCGGKTQVDLEHPPGLNAFAWNASVATTASNLIAAGWQQTTAADGRLEFEASIGNEAGSSGAPQSVGGNSDLPDAPADASITLFSQNDSLKVVRLLRRGNRATIRTYVADLAQDFGIEGPAWESEPRESNSATGNRTTRREQLFETSDAWVAVRMVITEAAEAQLSEASISEAELQYFGKSTNEGLSQNALVETLQPE